jgi:hypothetical protein
MHTPELGFTVPMHVGVVAAPTLCRRCCTASTLPVLDGSRPLAPLAHGPVQAHSTGRPRARTAGCARRLRPGSPRPRLDFPRFFSVSAGLALYVCVCV